MIDQKDFDIMMKEMAVNAPVEFRDVLKKLGFKDVRDVIEFLASRGEGVEKSDLGYIYAKTLENEDPAFHTYLSKNGYHKRYILRLKVMEGNGL